MSVLVTCGDTRAGLSAVRALGRAGVAVAVGAAQRPALAFWSRYATTTLLLPDATQDARRFAAVVADEVAGRGIAAVLPATDAALWALSRWRTDLPETARAILPPHDAVVFALDRTALHDRAVALGLSCLTTSRIGHADEIEPVLRRLAAQTGDHRLQALVRPLVPWEEREDGSRRLATALPIDSLGALRRLLYEREDLVEAGCVVEPRPDGRYLGYGAVCRDGEVLAEVFQERLREQGGLSGVSTLARTLPPDDAVRAVARPLLRALHFNGAALVELFVGDDGVVRLVNLIPRLWGSLGLALQAGVNVPLLLLRLARGDVPPPGALATPGAVWRWVAGDLEAVGRQTAHLVARVEGRGVLRSRADDLRELLALRAPTRRAGSDVFAADDPLPAALELQQRLRASRP
jgi:predicted ATP-grasp superfamily ATP-dependent carboligase